MNERIEQEIQRLLMEHGRLSLPGIGTLVVQEQPALVSYTQQVSPPSGNLIFNANLVIDDGRLRAGLGDDAYLLDDYLRQLRDSLDAGRSVQIDGVGKFTKHYDGDLRFTVSPEANYSKNAFGLPQVELKPIVRTERLATTSADPLSTEVPATAAGKEARGLKAWLYDPTLRKYGWYAVLLVGVAVGVYLLGLLAVSLSGTGTDTDEAPPVLVIPEDRLNVPPPIPDGTPGYDATSVRPDPPPRLNDPAPETGAEPEPEAPETPTTDLSPTGRTAVIAIGLFGRQRNVEKALRRLREAGYQPYTAPEGPGTRVGAEIVFDTQAELDAALVDLKARFTEQAFLYRLDGQRQRPR